MLQELLSLLLALPVLVPIAFFWCACCECMLDVPVFDNSSVESGGSVVSGTWSGFAGPWSTSSSSGEIRFTNSYSSSRGGVVRWEITIGSGARPAVVKIIGAYVDDDNYLYGTVEVDSSDDATWKLYQKIAGVESQIGKTVANNLASSALRVELAWNGQTASLGWWNSNTATATVCQSTEPGTAAPCTHNPSTWKIGVALVSQAASGLVSFSCFVVAARNDTKTTNSVFGFESATCNSINCCACIGEHTDEVAVTFSGVTASTNDNGTGCCPDPSILNDETFILSSDLSCTYYTVVTDDYVPGPPGDDGFRFGITYFRFSGTHQLNRKATHKLTITQGVCHDCSGGASAGHSGTFLSSGVTLDCEDYTAEIESFSQDFLVGQANCMCGMAGASATVEPVT